MSENEYLMSKAGAVSLIKALSEALLGNDRQDVLLRVSVEDHYRVSIKVNRDIAVTATYGEA